MEKNVMKNAMTIARTEAYLNITRLSRTPPARGTKKGTTTV